MLKRKHSRDVQTFLSRTKSDLKEGFRMPKTGSIDTRGGMSQDEHFILLDPSMNSTKNAFFGTQDLKMPRKYSKNQEQRPSARSIHSKSNGKI